jgi:hypothetical protein
MVVQVTSGGAALNGGSAHARSRSAGEDPRRMLPTFQATITARVGSQFRRAPSLAVLRPWSEFVGRAVLAGQVLTPVASQHVAVGDFDSDGDLDLVLQYRSNEAHFGSTTERVPSASTSLERAIAHGSGRFWDVCRSCGARRVPFVR